MTLEAFLAALGTDLDRRAREGRRRWLTLPSGIDLVSNDYLGLATHPTIVARMRESLAGEDGETGAGASRLLRGNRAAFVRLEERLAEWCKSDGALLFASGYAANLGLLQSLFDKDDLVLSDALNHASLIDGIRLSGARKAIYPHQDLGAVGDILRRRPRTGRAFVVTESVFSMDGDLTPLADLVEIAERHGALVIVDEAHATGLYGSRGSGRVEELGLRDRVLATVHTGGKALGCAGAWVAGASVLRETLVNRARPFVFSTAPLPVLAAGLDAALDVLAAEPKRRVEVHRKASLLRHALAEAGVAAGGASPIVPVVIGDDEAALAVQDGLQARGFDVRAVRPPTVPEGTARLRVTARVPVSDQDLVRFATATAHVMAALRAIAR